MLRNEQGEHIGIMGISRDITEQKQAEEALAVERERLVTTISGLAEGVITTDDTGKIVLLNPIAARLLEISENDALGQELWAVYHHVNADEKALQAEYEKVLCGEEAGGMHQRCVLLTSSGKQLPVSENIMALTGADNEVAGLVAVFRDINDEIRLQAEQTRAEKLESISVFAGGLAHDFNNFLASFSLNISLAILHSNENPKLKEILKNSEASIQMAKGLTKQLAALSRGRRPSKIKQDIRPLLRESVTYALRGTPVEPVYQLADDLWPSEFDVSQLNQVIHNLAISAKKAMPDGGRLTVSADNFVLSDQDKRSLLGPGNYNRISFHDSGSGMDVETMEKIFDPFFSTHQVGTGLELYSCHMIMEMHRGWITVDPEVDKGSRFTFYLPVDAPPHDSKTLPEPQLSDMGQRLLLDNIDNPGNETTTVPEELG